MEDIMKNGFTLAEVLITLGVVGVIAAMTLPSLITKVEKYVTVIKVKKLYSELNRNLRIAVSENGDIDDWDWSQNNGGGFSTLLDKYFEITDKENNTLIWKVNDAGGRYAFCPWAHKRYRKNGQLICISNFMSGGYAWSMGPVVYIVVDINGDKKPNRVGRDVFTFLIPSKNANNGCDSVHYGYFNHNSNFVYPVFYKCPRDYLLKRCNNTGEGGNYNGLSCAELIRSDGWKIKDGYPW